MHIEVDIPTSQSGDWIVEPFEILEKGAHMHNMQDIFSGNYHRGVVAGKYTRLMHRGQVIMSNTPSEVRDHMEFILKAKELGGDILINGLGIGMALTEILKEKSVKSVTIIEIEEDVIKLIKPHIKDKRVTIIHADALKWKAPKGKKFSAVWHDIWPTISSDNNDSMSTLHRKYGKRCEWQDSWVRYRVKQLLREEREDLWYKGLIYPKN